MLEALRACIGCGEPKPLCAFPRNAKSRGGYKTRCNVCLNRAQRERCRADPEAYRAYKAQWRRENPTKAAIYTAKWRRENPTKAAEGMRRSNAKAVETMAPGRVAGMLGLSVSELLPEVLALKRAQIARFRLAKQLKRVP